MLHCLGSVFCVPHVLKLVFCVSSVAPQLVGAGSKSQQETDEAQASSSMAVNESEATTNIQIRLADGGRLVQRFNHTHRSADRERQSAPLRTGNIQTFV